MSRHTGIVKFFSSNKGYGFITLTNEPVDSPYMAYPRDIFCHHSNITANEGQYRTLARGTVVEFDLELMENNTLKATKVTAPGGQPIPPPSRTKRTKKANEMNGKETLPFHTVIIDEIKKQIEDRGIDIGARNTVDIAIGDDVRVKLGQGGYAGFAKANGTVGEGTYECNRDGLLSFKWERCLSFHEGEWQPADPGSLIQSISLLDPRTGTVEMGETPEKFWGADKPDPKDTFRQHGFLMRRVVLSRPLPQNAKERETE